MDASWDEQLNSFVFLICATMIRSMICHYLTSENPLMLDILLAIFLLD